VLGGRKLLLGLIGVKLVQALCQALCGAAVVYEDNRRRVFSYEL
jgi:hypothetical protein